MPALGDQPFKAGIQVHPFVVRQSLAIFQKRGDGIVFLDQGTAQYFRGMRRKHQFDAQSSDLLGRRILGPNDIQRRLPLHGDVGQIQELIERPRDVGEFVFRSSAKRSTKRCQSACEPPPRPLGQRTEHFDARHEIVAAMVGDHVAQHAAQQAHVVAQTRAANPRVGCARNPACPAASWGDYSKRFGECEPWRHSYIRV